MRRRLFNALGIAGLVSLLGGCLRFAFREDPGPDVACRPASGSDYDYIVIGSGAGGGPLAANLAREGFRVLLLEAGGDDESPNYQVPAFHAFATEDPALRWDYFVRHYADEARQRRDWKYASSAQALSGGGVLYPRAGTLGGCTAHNAMITVYGHNSDWDELARLLGDASWNGANMRRYFERLERCQYVARPERPAEDPRRHGFDGWLSVEAPDTELAGDSQVSAIIRAAALEYLGSRPSLAATMSDAARALTLDPDPNDWRFVQRSAEGVFVMPMATHRRKRNGPREYLRQVAAGCPGQLTIKTHALATRILLEGRRAVGVEYREGAHLYRADPRHQHQPSAPRREVRAAREVIVAAGAFNSPQLLMLSGIGPVAELARLGIEPRVPLAGVGANLQDRYEVGVALELAAPFEFLKAVSFDAPRSGEIPDAVFKQWQEGRGVYASNGAVLGVATRSSPRQAEPDLFVFGLVSHFEGYYPGYSEKARSARSHFTWSVLKAHTRNRGGTVRLRSADPTDTPMIDFAYFEEGTDAAGEDLEAVVAGVEQARRISARFKHLVRREIAPGSRVQTRDELRQWVRDHAWGHHACGTCRMGAAGDAGAVTDARLRVHGVDGLRVVDASVFPRIPGFFIATPIFMLSEKAAEMIVADARA